MASLRRKRRSKYWFACFALKDGTRTQRSTKETDRKKAQKIADAFEKAARTERTARQTQHVIAELYRDITGDMLHFPTVREHFESWLARKKPEISPSSYQAYSRTAHYFLQWLGGRADKQINLVTRGDVVGFRNGELGRISASTVNDEVKALRMVFKSAREDGHLQDNPADGVRPARESTSKRRAFTLPELRRVIKEADDEWRSLIFFGLYTGQRLGDLARLTWQNVDLDRDEIRFVSGKMKRQMIIPIASPLRENIENLDAGEDDPGQPLHPRAFAHVEKSAGRVGTLSRQFYDLLADAGLAAPRNHRRLERAAPGRAGRRRLSDISFHALRHTATSLMKNAGISPAIVQDLVGHESAAISAHYTHVDEAAKRRAISALPKI